MHLVVGLGNIGPEYEKTRHNIGFQVADKFQTAFGLEPFSVSTKHKCFLSEGKNVKLIKPTTLMNASGDAVQSVAHFFKIPHDRIIVVHDDLDVLFGKIKIQFDKSAAGHKGVQSIIDRLHTSAFWRIRIGISPESKGTLPSEKFVLTEFSKDEQAVISTRILADTYIALMQIIKEEADKAAQTFNQKNPRTKPAGTD